MIAALFFDFEKLRVIQIILSYVTSHEKTEFYFHIFIYAAQ